MILVGEKMLVMLWAQLCALKEVRDCWEKRLVLLFKFLQTSSRLPTPSMSLFFTRAARAPPSGHLYSCRAPIFRPPALQQLRWWPSVGACLMQTNYYLRSTTTSARQGRRRWTRSCQTTDVDSPCSERTTVKKMRFWNVKIAFLNVTLLAFILH